MKFIPRIPADGINVSKQHPLTEATTLLIGLSGLFALATVVIIFFVDMVLLFIPPSTEHKLFRRLAADSFFSADYESASALALQRQVDGLVESWPENPYEFRVGIVDAPEPNALALPGGIILVTDTLLRQAETENELAFVLGHEIGHFSNRDHLRQLGRAALLSLLVAALLGRSADSAPTGLADLALRGFGRQQETEADLIGLRLVQQTYGHVNQSWRFFERMAAAENTSGPFASFAATHPSSSDRVSKLREIAKANGWSMTGPVTPLTAY